MIPLLLVASHSSLFPFGAKGSYQLLDFVFYFWLGVTALCAIALLLVLIKQHKIEFAFKCNPTF
jgi:hypothetical protein